MNVPTPWIIWAFGSVVVVLIVTAVADSSTVTLNVLGDAESGTKLGLNDPPDTPSSTVNVCNVLILAFSLVTFNVTGSTVPSSAVTVIATLVGATVSNAVSVNVPWASGSFVTAPGAPVITKLDWFAS